MIIKILGFVIYILTTLSENIFQIDKEIQDHRKQLTISCRTNAKLALPGKEVEAIIELFCEGNQDFRIYF